MATQAENDAVTRARGVAQAAAENAKYQAKKLAAKPKEEAKFGLKKTLMQRSKKR